MTQDVARHFKIRGMDCAEEVAVLKREVGPPGRRRGPASFDILKARMTVAAAAGRRRREILKAVERTGMRAAGLAGGPRRAEPEGVWQRRGRTVLTAASGLARPRRLRRACRPGGRDLPRPGSEGWALAHAVPLAARCSIPLGDPRRLLVRAAEGVVRPAAAAAGHEPADDGRRRRARSASANGSRGDRRLPLRPLAGARILERGARPAGRRRPDGPVAADRPGPRPDGARGGRAGRGGARSAPASSSGRASASRWTAAWSHGVERGQPGADHRRERAGPQGGGRRGVRRHHQRRRRAGGRVHQGGPRTPRWPTSSAWSGRRSRAARPRSSGSSGSPAIYTPAVMGLALAGPPRAAAAVRRRVGRLVLPGAGAAGHRLPLRAGDLDAGQHRRRPGRRGAARRAGQGRAVHGGAGPAPGGGARQDGHAHLGAARRGRGRPARRPRRAGTARTGWRAWRPGASTPREEKSSTLSKTV